VGVLQVRQHTSAYVGIRQRITQEDEVATDDLQTLKWECYRYVSIRQHTSAYAKKLKWRRMTCRRSSGSATGTSAYVGIRQRMLAPQGAQVGVLQVRQHTSAYVSVRQHSSAYVSIRQHTSAYVSIRQHTSAYVSIRQHTLYEVATDDLHADVC
jgi:hypothetical protein